MTDDNRREFARERSLDWVGTSYRVETELDDEDNYIVGVLDKSRDEYEGVQIGLTPEQVDYLFGLHRTGTVVNPSHRLAWREHLTAVALSEEHAEWEQGEYTPAEHMAYIRGMAMLIGNATWLETEHTSDVEEAAYQTILSAYTKREAEHKRERWTHAVNTGATDLGFHDWVAAYYEV